MGDQPNPILVAWQEEQAKKLEGAKIGRLPFRVNRLGGVPTIVDVGEQIVNSSHRFKVTQPMPLPGADVGGLMQVSLQAALHTESPFRQQTGLDPDPLLALNLGAFVLDERLSSGYYFGRDQYPIEVQFTPTAAGLFQAEVVFEVTWNDRGVEKHVVRLIGRAREIDVAPQQPVRDDRPRPLARPEPDRLGPGGPEPSPNDVLEFVAAVERAKEQAKFVAKWQKEGVVAAEGNAMSFKQMPPDAPWWEELLELAMTMGAYGVFGAVAKKLGPRLARTINASVQKDDFLEVAVTDGLKDGFKLASRNKTRERQRSHKNATGPEGKQAVSSNARINFFAEQRAILLSLEEANGDVIEEKRATLKNRLARDPVAVITAFDLLTEELALVKETAAAIQQTVSEQQWISAVSIASSEGERVFDPHLQEHRVVSNVTKNAGKREASNGVLTIQVTAKEAEPLDQVAVRGASIKGVSQELADRLHGVSLTDAPIPIMLVVDFGRVTAWITRDEVGRIRVSGAFPTEAGYTTGPESQMHRAASEILRAVLAQPLRTWGVELIRTNDGTGQGD